MAQAFTSALLAAAFLGRSAVGTPVSTEQVATPSQMLGFDEDFVQVMSSNSLIPDVTVLNEFDFSNDTTAEPLEIPVEEVLKRYINGVDDRYQYTNPNYPFSAVGKLQWSNGVFCSGALVGPRHVLTAKHCLTEGASGTFSPGWDRGAPFGSGAITHIVTSGHEWGSPCGWKGDWAILIMDQRLGDRLGYFGVKLPENTKMDQDIFHHVGYPVDRDNGDRPYRTNGNRIQSFRPWDCDSTGPFYTDTDCHNGQSGGPHWEVIGDARYIWGTLAVTFAAANNVAWAGWGSGNEMLDAVIRTRNDFP